MMKVMYHHDIPLKILNGLSISHLRYYLDELILIVINWSSESSQVITIFKF
jgi:hypothetical protein